MQNERKRECLIDRKSSEFVAGKLGENESQHDICVTENDSVVARENDMDEDVIESIEKEKS